MVNGILNINKPQGVTSFGVVARIRRLTGVKRAGHAGTLDPLATGVLPVCLGHATRVIEYLADSRKTYLAEMLLGITTDTQDIEGTTLEQKDPATVTLDRFTSLLPSFTGIIEQVPPMYSAVKYKGQPLYQLARAGQTVERKSRTAEIYSLVITRWEPPIISLSVECSKGTYIRTLIHDMGQELGCGAVMQNLVRSAYGPFAIEQAVSPDTLEEAVQDCDWQQYLAPVDAVLDALTPLTVTEEDVEEFRHGRPVSLEEPLPDTARLPVRVYSPDGSLVCIAQYDAAARLLQPKKVFLKSFQHISGGLGGAA